jgi:predicted nucleic acid-binding protein
MREGGAMGKLRVYLETTIFNRYFEDNREYAKETKMLFEKIATGEIDAYTSVAVLAELEQAPEPKRSKMLGLVASHDITVWVVEQNAYDLADLYIEMDIIPTRYRLDGVHIAMAALGGMDCIISLNFHHINKLKTKTATEIVHRMKGYGSPFICTPMEVIDNEK